MFWYKIEVSTAENESYTFVGSSNESLDGLAAKAGRGEYIHLTNLLYHDRGEIKEWGEWDASLEPEVYINPTKIHTMMQFKGDPRDTPTR